MIGFNVAPFVGKELEYMKRKAPQMELITNLQMQRKFLKMWNVFWYLAEMGL